MMSHRNRPPSLADLLSPCPSEVLKCREDALILDTGAEGGLPLSHARARPSTMLKILASSSCVFITPPRGCIARIPRPSLLLCRRCSSVGLVNTPEESDASYASIWFGRRASQAPNWEREAV